MTNPKVLAARQELANRIKTELSEIYDAAMMLSKDYGYRFQPSSEYSGWFDVIDGHGVVISTICPVQMTDPTKECEQMAEDAINFVRDIKVFKDNVFGAIWYTHTCEPIHEQQRNLKKSQEAQEQISVLRKTKHNLENNIKEIEKEIAALEYDTLLLKQ